MTKSGQLVVLAGSKVRGLREGGKKPAKLVWTQAWRRMHKKLNVETSSRRRVKKIVKASVSRAYVGMDAAAVRDYYWASSMRVRPACTDPHNQLTPPAPSLSPPFVLHISLSRVEEREDGICEDYEACRCGCCRREG